MLSSPTSLESTRKRLSFRLNKLRQQKIVEPLPHCWICSGCATADPVPRAHHFPDLRRPCRAKFAHDRVGRFISAWCQGPLLLLGFGRSGGQFAALKKRRPRLSMWPSHFIRVSPWQESIVPALLLTA